MIIFLNGASSVGKSCIARQIMRQSNRPFIYFSIDHLIDLWMDGKFIVFEGESDEWFNYQSNPDPAGNVVTHMVSGPHAEQLHWDMIEALTVLIKKGYDLVIDEVLWNAKIFEKYTEALKHAQSVYLIKVICELIDCERREKKRIDRFQGLARALYWQVYPNCPYYDLEIDTTYASSEQCAKEILEFVHMYPHPEAFLKVLKMSP
jgi:chloramphenicol 3-O phosphotransferase